MARKRADFLAEKVADKKKTPSKGCLRNIYTISRRIRVSEMFAEHRSSEDA
jgi:hypothetical protein